MKGASEILFSVLCKNFGENVELDEFLKLFTSCTFQFLNSAQFFQIVGNEENIASLATKEKPLFEFRI